jgi:hypothetical protein
MPIKFAGKLNSFSRGPRGFFVKLEIGADDDWQELAAAPLGTTFGVAMVPIDPETGVSIEASPGGLPSQAPAKQDTGQQRGEAGKPRRHFDELPMSQQAALLCNDERFIRWVQDETGWKAAPGQSWRDAVADYVRYTCTVTSRADIAADQRSGQAFARMLATFRQDTGQMAEQRA